MSPLRKTALVGGVLYLLTFVSIPTLPLYGSVHDPNYVHTGLGTLEAKLQVRAAQIVPGA
jgi:hypothetical protein